jgi:hypothetical protein
VAKCVVLILREENSSSYSDVTKCPATPCFDWGGFGCLSLVGVCLP